MFSNQNGQLTPIVVQAPGGGHNPEFNAMFARNLGFGPPPQQPAHNVGAGTFDMGGGHQLHVKINGKTPEAYAQNKAKSMIWGWIIGAIFFVVLLLVFGGIGIYVYVVAQDSGASAGATRTVKAGAWDGKTTFECKGNDAVTLTGVTATAGIKASANCQLTLVNVSITAPIAIDASANAKVTMTGGNINASTSSVVAAGGSKVDLVGTKVTGKAKKSGNAAITGAPM